MTIPTKNIIKTDDGEIKVEYGHEEITYAEEWKPVFFKNLDSGYRVSSYGRVKNRNGSICKLYYDKNGYTRFCLYIPTNDLIYNNAKRIAYPYKTHRAVALAFVINDDPEKNTVVMHKNDIVDCNFKSNLQWGTHMDNMSDKINKGRLRVLHGSEKPDAFFNEKDVIEICELLEKGIRSTNDIIVILGKTNMSRPFITKYKNLIANIRKRHCWNFITDKYNY